MEFRCRIAFLDLLDRLIAFPEIMRRFVPITVTDINTEAILVEE